MEFSFATKNDIQQLTELRIAYTKEDLGNISEADEKILAEKLPEYFAEHLNKDCIAFVARDEDTIAAVALLIIIEKPCSPKFINGLVGEVLSVYTRPEYRHQGLCSNLMKLLLDCARGKGLNKVELKATDDGYPVYKTVGFADAGGEYKAMVYKF